VIAEPKVLFCSQLQQRQRGQKRNFWLRLRLETIIFLPAENKVVFAV
jgi:hypothetical protein